MITIQTMLIAIAIATTTRSLLKGNQSAAGQQGEDACLTRQYGSVNQIDDGQLFLILKKIIIYN